MVSRAISRRYVLCDPCIAYCRQEVWGMPAPNFLRGAHFNSSSFSKMQAVVIIVYNPHPTDDAKWSGGIQMWSVCSINLADYIVGNLNKNELFETEKNRNYLTKEMIIIMLNSAFREIRGLRCLLLPFPFYFFCLRIFAFGISYWFEDPYESEKK